MVAAFFAAPAMAGDCGQCCDPCCEDATLNSVDGAMTFGEFPANINFDFVKQGNQEAWTFGFAKANPIATNAFNLEKNQVAGALFDKGIGQTQLLKDGGSGDRKDNDLASTQVANIEIIQSGNQVARAVGAGVANNQVNIKTSQTPCSC
ncbi:MAG TPA: hypothetical protein P5049_08370 [Methanothrix sp.]|nr:hypothetical protein [Methanothrix sp.]